jgi:hypothetical protein
VSFEKFANLTKSRGFMRMEEELEVILAESTCQKLAVSRYLAELFQMTPNHAASANGTDDASFPVRTSQARRA